MSQLLEKADQAFSKKNFDYAIELWLQHLKFKPDDLEIRQKLRSCARASSSGKGGFGSFIVKLRSKFTGATVKDPEQAMQAYEETLKSDPSNLDVLMALGKAAMDANFNQVAAWVFSDVVSLDRKHKEGYRYAGRAYKALEDYQAAIKQFEALKKLDASDKEAADEIRGLAAKSTEQNMAEKTKGAKGGGGGFQALIDKDAAGKMERLAKRVRTPEQAKERITDLLEELGKDPENPRIFKLLSDMHLMCSEYKEAKDYLTKAAKISPDDGEVVEKLADLKLREFDDELESLKKSAKSDAGAKEKYQQLSKERLLFEVGEYKRRMEAHPTELKWAFEYGRSLHDASKYEEAIAALQKAKGDARFKATGGYYLGRCLFKMKNARMALKELETAREDLSDMEDETVKKITYMIGFIYEAAKKKEKALEEYEKIAQVDYNYSDIQKRMEGLGSL